MSQLAESCRLRRAQAEGDADGQAAAQSALRGLGFANPARISDVWVSAEAGRLYTAKAARLRAEDARGTVVALTAFPFTQPRLSGVPPRTYGHHLFSELRTRRAHDALVEAWRADGPDTVLIDDPSEGFVGSEAEVAWQARFASELTPVYTLDTVADGWWIYRRVEPR